MGRLLSCLRKARYPTKETATEHAIHALRRPGNTVHYLRPYECRHCNGWHLTSQPLREQGDQT